MKHLITICTILIALLWVMPEVKAQSNKLVFATEVNYYEAGVKRNNTAVAQQHFNSVLTLIADEIAAINIQIQNTTNPTTLAMLNTKKGNMQQLQTDIQALQNNIVTNYNAIKVKMNDFLAIM